jgi:general secretion pathway protein J
MQRRPRRGAAGFTLVEVLVALFIMALLATLAWQGMDGMVRARDGSARSLDRTMRLNTVLTQWEQDLQALHDTGAVPAIGFDGQSLLLTRRSDEGVVLVAWAVREGRWQRWTSLPLRRQGEVQQAWLQAQQLLGTDPGQLTVADDASDWQLYFYRGNAWSNAQSSAGFESGQGGAEGELAPPGTDGTPPGPNVPLREALPDGVRLVITLDGRVLTRDLALEANG